MKTACIVLAAGRSRRFGENKLLKEITGKSVIAHTLASIPADRFERCVCVCSSDEVESEIIRCGFTPVRYPGGALSDSIRTGLDATRDCDAWMFINADQPLIRTESIIRLLEAFKAEPSCVCRLSYGETQASPAIFPHSAYEGLYALNGERGGMYAAKSMGLRIIPVQAEHESELWDVDDPAAFRRVLKYFSINLPFGKE